MAAPDVLLFDLGGVLVETSGVAELQRLAGVTDAAALRRRLVASPAFVRFETGRCSAEDFARDFLAEWGLGLAPEAFLQLFASWVKAPAADTLELLAGLRRRYTLACLSSTNAVHWRRVLGERGLRDALDRHFASHELGLLKPGAEIYARAAQELGCEPAAIVFFDDAPENVAGARAAGMEAHLVAGCSQLRPTLAGLGLA